MKKLYKIVVGVLLAATLITGCTKKEDRPKISDEKVAECTWFENKETGDAYKLDKISFSKDEETVVLSYATRGMNTELSEYYKIYSTKFDGDCYDTPKEIKFDSGYFVISAHISYTGDEIIFTGLPAEQAKDASGFSKGCNLYIGNFKNNKVSNVKELEFGEEGKRYYISSVLEDGSIMYNAYDDKKDEFVSKYAKKDKDGNYTVSNVEADRIDGYYWNLIYVNDNKSFVWRGDEKDKSFTALTGEFEDDRLQNLSEMSPEFMNSKSYKSYYSAVGYDRSGGIYYYELDSQTKLLKLYRSKVEQFSK